MTISSQCEVCGQPISSGRGRPNKYCKKTAGQRESDCAAFAKRMREMQELLPRILGRITRSQLVELRHTIFCWMCDDIPRVRDEKGRFSKRGGDGPWWNTAFKETKAWRAYATRNQRG